MKKSVYTLFLCICICFCCCGCATVQTSSEDIFQTNAFRLLRQTANSGQIGMAYIFPVNSKELSAQGYSEKQIETFKFYLTTYINALAKNNALKASEGVSVGNCQYYKDIDGIGFAITFENAEAQNKFFGVEEVQGSNSAKKQSSGFFIKKTTLKTNFPFSKKSAGDLKMICLMAMSSWASDQNLDEQQLEKVKQILEKSVFIYDFSTQQSGLRSEIVYEDENFYHNVFIKTFEQFENDNEIMFWTMTPNYPIWYIFALVFVLFLMFLFLIILRKKANT